MIKKNKSIRHAKVLGAVGLLFGFSAAFAGPGDSLPAAQDRYLTENRTIPFAGTSTLMLNPNYNPLTSGTSLNKHFNYIGGNQGKALFSDDLVVSGVVRFLTIYRNMGDHYDDMATSEKNISFSDYPLVNVASNANGGYPMLELNLASKIRTNIDFNVGYSLSPVFTGDVLGNSSRQASARQNINFSGRIRNGLFQTSVMAGEVLWTNLSKFTMGQPEYRDNYFNRLPWDWYRRSFERFSEYYTMSSNIGNQALGRSPLVGVVFETEYLPYQISVKGLFGRTNRNVAIAQSVDYFPSYTAAGRLEKVVFERAIRGKVGYNYYAKRAKTTFTSGLPDNNTVSTLDFDFKIKKVNVSGEFGAGKLENPATGKGTWAPGFYFRTEFDKRVVLVPFSVEYYNIAEGLGSLDGGILNSNASLGDGGFSTEKIYDNLQFTGISQEVGQISNNRQGVNFRAEGGIGKYVKVQLGYAFGAERKNLHDSITIQHRVNDFSRSRLRPWFQAGGPYHRVKSYWFRTFETITIDPAKAGASGSYLKGFNTLELFTKAKLKLGKHELVLLNFNSYNVVSKKFTPIAGMPGNKNTLISVFYEDFTAAFSITKKFNVVAEAGFETVKGSVYTDLSPDKILDANGNAYADEDRVISQLGTTLAAGVDYDINRNMSLHLRHRYFTHKDYNFSKDKFNGHETTFELKIFF